MAQNRVELVVTADDAKAAQAFVKLIEQTRLAAQEADKTGDKITGLGAKAKSTGDEGANSLSKIVTSLASGGALATIFTAALDGIREKIKAAAAEAERVDKKSTSFGQSMANIASSNSDITPERLAAMQRNIVQTLSVSALGEGGGVKLADAAGAISRSSLPPDVADAIIRETAQTLQMSPEANATTLAKSYAAIVEAQVARGQAPNANSAQNLVVGMGGAITDVGKRASMLESLQPFSAQSGMSMSEIAGLTGFISTQISDTEGGDTARIVQSLYSKLVADPSAIEAKLGSKLSGSLIERLQQAQSMGADTLLGDDAFNIVGMERGPKARLAISGLIGAGGKEALQQQMSKAAAAAAYGGDLQSELISMASTTSPAFAADLWRKQELSKLDAQRLMDFSSQRDAASLVIFKEQIKRERLSEQSQEGIINSYSAFMGSNVPENVRRERARSAGHLYNTVGRIPDLNILGTKIPLNQIVEGAIDAGSVVEAKTGFTGVKFRENSAEQASGVSTGFEDRLATAVARGVRDGLQSSKPRTPLGAGGLNR